MLSEIEEGKVFEEWVGKRQFLALRFCRSRRKGSALKNLAGALYTDRVGCTLSVGGEVKMEIPDTRRCSFAVTARSRTGACLWRSGPPKRSRFSAALNGYFPNLLAVDGCRDIVIAIGNKLPRPCEIAHRRKLEEISHAKHC